MTEQDNHQRQLSAKIDELRHSLANVRRQPGPEARSGPALEQGDVSGSFPEYPDAEHCGFTVELKVSAGISTVRLELIEQGSDWQPFLEQKLEREITEGPEEAEPDDDELDSSQPERILKLPSLSASKAFELLQPALQRHARRVTTDVPIFSVLTPAYNSKPKWLTEAALSLANQTLADWEWCIVDDGSDSRGTRKLLESLMALSPRVRVQFASNGGISAACNQALDLARGEYVCFLDHDDHRRFPGVFE